MIDTKLSGAHVELVRLPMQPVINAGERNEISFLDLVLVSLRDASGAIGEGLAYTINGLGLIAVASTARDMCDRLTAADRPAGALLDGYLNGFRGFFGASGVALSARAAVEEALWDLEARTAGTGIAQRLGIRAQPLPVYFSGGLWADRPVDELCETASHAVARGFRGLKLRLGSDMTANVERVRRVRQQVGPGPRILLDSNQRWTRQDAIKMAHMVAEFDIAWFEEPIDHRDHEGEALVRASIPMPLATGETVWDSAGVEGIVAHNAADVIMPDLQRMGGPQTMVEVCRRLGQRGQAVSSHLSHEMNLALMIGQSNAVNLEYLPWFEPIYAQRLRLDADGNAVIPDTPGWGFTFDREAVDRFGLDL
jgi:L-alanine-DL-glutamate epimerase-like enolase superfamily enzyme